jgi:hypothetical protein
MIKCLNNNRSYIGRTDSKNEKYNPISILYKRYKQDKTRYIKLGEEIVKEGYRNFAFVFVKEGLNDEDSNKLVSESREKLLERSLHDEKINNIDIFKDDLSLFEITTETNN